MPWLPASFSDSRTRSSESMRSGDVERRRRHRPAAPRRPGCAPRPTPDRHWCRGPCGSPLAVSRRGGGRERPPGAAARLAADRAFVRGMAGAVGRLGRRTLALQLLRPLASRTRRSGPSSDPGLRMAPRRSLLPAMVSFPSVPRASSGGRTGCPRRRRRPRSARRGPGRPRRSPCAARASARSCSATCTRASTTPCRSEDGLAPARASRSARRVEAEHVEHRPDGQPAAAQLVGRTVGQQLVALPQHALQRRERGGHPQVVVHRVDELGAHQPPAAAAPPGADSPSTSAARRTNPSIRRKPAAASSSASKENSTTDR